MLFKTKNDIHINANNHYLASIEKKKYFEEWRKNFIHGLGFQGENCCLDINQDFIS